MVILKHGNIPRVRFKCKMCDCEFEEPLRKDVIQIEEDNFVLPPAEKGGEERKFIFFKYKATCPDCGNVCEANTNDIKIYNGLNLYGFNEFQTND